MDINKGRNMTTYNCGFLIDENKIFNKIENKIQGVTKFEVIQILIHLKVSAGWQMTIYSSDKLHVRRLEAMMEGKHPWLIKWSYMRERRNDICTLQCT